MNRVNIPQLRFKRFEGEWKQQRLGEVSNFLDGKRKPIKSDDRSKMKGEYPYYGASGIIDYVNNYIFDEELILLGEDGENIISRNSPLAFRVSGKCWINNHAHVIVPKENTNIDFLTHNLERINYVVYNTGTAQPKLNQEVCRNIPSWFPTLPEQQKIASFLSAVEEKIQQLSRKKELLEQYKKGIMQQLFSGNLRFKDENGKDYADWEEKKLGDVINLQSGFAFKSELFNYNGDKLVTPKNFTKNGFGNFTEQHTKYTSESCHEKYNCKPGDLLLLLTDLTQSCELLGKPLLVRQENGNMLLNQRVVKVITTNESEVSFLLYFFQTTAYEKRIKETSSGTTVRHSSNKIILETSISLPSIKEQQKIANFLSSIDAKIESANQQINQTQSFKKGLLQQLFV